MLYGTYLFLTMVNEIIFDEKIIVSCQPALKLCCKSDHKT